MERTDATAENSRHHYSNNKIPLRNLWLLMLYASDLFLYAENKKDTSAEENPDKIPDLIAEVLTHVVEQRLQRNLNISYQPRQENLRRVRGRIDLFKTERHHLLQKAQVACRFEELTTDTPRNRYVRDALDFLAGKVKEKDLAHRCRKLSFHLRQAGVIGMRPTHKQVLGMRFARHDKNDKEMIFIAKLAFDLALPDESTASGNSLFAPDSKRMWELYEKAVAGFYKTVLQKQGWKIMPQKTIRWQNDLNNAENFLPSMNTDITMDNKTMARRIVVDTKYNNIFAKNMHGGQKLKSGHIYQMYAYLRSQENTDELSAHAEGLLLYPSIDVNIDEHAFIQGHVIRFKTIDLMASALEIREQLLQAILPMQI